MDCKTKILQNLRDQAIIRKQLERLQRDGDKYTANLNRLMGGMELLSELFKEENGVDINAYISQNQQFQNAVRNAGLEGERIAESTAPVDSVQKDQESSTVSHTGNKPMLRKVEPKVELAEEKKQPEVVRTRNPPKILIDDDLPLPPEDDEDRD